MGRGGGGVVSCGPTIKLLLNREWSVGSLSAHSDRGQTKALILSHPDTQFSLIYPQKDPLSDPGVDAVI